MFNQLVANGLTVKVVLSTNLCTQSRDQDSTYAYDSRASLHWTQTQHLL